MITLNLLHPHDLVPIQTWSFPNESVIRIGRSRDNNVVLYSSVVSRHHVELQLHPQGWEVVNTGANGTFLDGHQITKAPVVDGTIFRLAVSGPQIQIRINKNIG